MKTLNQKPKSKKALPKEQKDIKFQNIVSKPAEEEEVYNPEFVAKILQSREDIKNGNFTRVKLEDLHDFLGL